MRLTFVLFITGFAFNVNQPRACELIVDCTDTASDLRTSPRAMTAFKHIRTRMRCGFGEYGKCPDGIVLDDVIGDI